MRAPLVIRLSGWGVTLAGGALILYSFTDDSVARVQNPFFMAGAVVFVVGMILTSASGLVATIQRSRMLKERIEDHKASRDEPPSPPG
jgi:hypothetical protein